ncbi:MAG: hypothetical protein GXY58_10535 [Planctomycetaceae bacterium]|nr:hypothetical protein [Planctomycetaceae bacterium]
MAQMSIGEVAILLGASYVAVLTLVRLMRRRRDAIVAELQTEVAAQLERKHIEKQREQNRKKRGKQPPSAAQEAKP